MMRDAMRSAAALGGGRTYARVLDARDAPTLEKFPCAALCMECRFLDDPAHPGDPMRSDDVTTRREPCPHCGANAWAELRNRETAAMVVDVDDVESVERRRRRQRAVVRLLLMGLLVAGLATMTMVVSSEDQADLLLTLATAAVVFVPIVAVPLLSTASGRSFLSRRRTSPARWRMASPAIPKRKGASTRGAAQGAVLRAPLTGRPCIAYELAIREDDRPRAAAHTWALVEQRNAAMVVDGHRIAPDQAAMALVRQRIDRANVAIVDEQLELLLRIRGLNPALPHVLYETIVAPGQPVRVWATTHTPPRLEAV